MTPQDAFWTPDGIRSAAGGTWLARPADGASPINGVSIDSRAVAPGQAFVAIKGDRTDGHLYLAEACACGAALLIVSDEPSVRVLPGVGVFRVADTRAALIRLGAAWRKLLDGTRVVAVVGSNGKTTTVRLIDAALGASMRGTASIKSFNNSVGVPLTILNARRGDQYLVCEVGTSAPGEIASLAQVVQPDAVVITSIGREHLEFLGSLRGVATEEASALDHLRPGGIGVITADSPELDEIIRARTAQRTVATSMLRFGTGPGADVRVVRVEPFESGTAFELNDRATFTIPLIGAHNACNAAAAVAVARRFRVDDDAIRRGLATATGAPMRLERRRVGTVELVNDAYNANPDSVLAAIGTLRAIRPVSGGRRVLVLGDMLELGPDGPAMHDEVVRAAAADASIDRVALVGPLMAARAEIVRAARGDAAIAAVVDSSAPNAALIADLVAPGDVVLLKGSRGMRLERVAEAIEVAQTRADIARADNSWPPHTAPVRSGTP